MIGALERQHLIFAFCVSLLGGVAVAQSTVPDVDLSRSLRKAPWFDTTKDELRPMEMVPRSDDSIHRDSRWSPKAKKLKKATNTNQNATATGGSGGIFGTGFTWTNLIAWILLIAVVLGIIGGITYAMSRAELELGVDADSKSEDAKKKAMPDAELLERIKHLPPELRRTDVNLRSECERLMNEGRFDQAIILLLGHQLLWLDRNGLLRLSRGKTNGRYVRETKSHDKNCGRWLRATADAFEHSYFGRHDIPSHVFDALWQQNAKLEDAAQQIGGVQ